MSCRTCQPAAGDCSGKCGSSVCLGVCVGMESSSIQLVALLFTGNALQKKALQWACEGLKITLVAL